MRKRTPKFTVLVIFLAAIFFAAPQLAQSATVVSVEPGGAFSNIGGFQFDILSPLGTLASSFIPTVPASWSGAFSFASTVIYFDLVGSSSLPNGPIGSFNIDVILGNWVFSDQLGKEIPDSNYVVNHIGANYVVSAVPIPAAVWLLGGGLAGLMALRRRMS